jgi:hypothetical protein
MSLPEFNFATVFLIMAVWLLVGVLLGLVIGAAVHEADERGEAECDEDPQGDPWRERMDVELWEAQMRHPSSWERWA